MDDAQAQKNVPSPRWGDNASTEPSLLDVSEDRDKMSEVVQKRLCNMDRRRGCGRKGYGGDRFCPCGASDEYLCFAYDGWHLRYWDEVWGCRSRDLRPRQVGDDGGNYYDFDPRRRSSRSRRGRPY